MSINLVKPCGFYKIQKRGVREYFIVYHDVFWLDVTMDDVIEVQVLNGEDYRANVVLSVVSG